MDDMYIKSEMGLTLIGRALSKIISEKIGQDVKVKFKEHLRVCMNENGMACIDTHIYTEFELTPELLKEVI
jgi:hypothetical protein